MCSGYASAGMASSGTTTTGRAATLVGNDVVLTDDDRPTGVGITCQCGKSSDVLGYLAFGKADFSPSPPDVDAIAGS